MGLPHIWTPAMVAVVRAGWGAGDKIKDIGAKVGLHYGAVARKALQMKLGPHPKGSKRIAPDVTETVQRMAPGRAIQGAGQARVIAMLLADRGTGKEGFPVLRRRFGAGAPLLRRSLRDCLHSHPRPGGSGGVIRALLALAGYVPAAELHAAPDRETVAAERNIAKVQQVILDLSP